MTTEEMQLVKDLFEGRSHAAAARAIGSAEVKEKELNFRQFMKDTGVDVF